MIELKNLACRRGGRLVFRGLDFRLEAGCAALLRGPNGVGKSSLLRVIAGFVPPAEGDVRINNVALSKDRAGVQEQIAYAGHLDAVKPALTVAQNLAHWAGLFGGVSVEQALETFGLDTIADRPAAQCSAGQKRRLGLARLMVTDRPVWLLDEPTVSLDADSAALVARLVRDHCATGRTALIATHIDLDLGAPAVLQMSPVQPDHRQSGDAFLEGDWT